MNARTVLPLAVTLTLAVAWVAFLRRWSRTAQETGNVPPPRVWPNLLKLAWASQPMLREGGTVTSAYRSPATNAALRSQGSAEHSRHLDGLAVDVVGPDLEALEAVAWSGLKEAGGPWDDAFIHNGTHVHAELRSDVTFKEIARAVPVSALLAEVTGVRALLSRGTVTVDDTAVTVRRVEP